MLPDLEGLLRRLVGADVDLVVIGGIAVAAHSVVRATEDLDIVPDAAEANIRRLAELLRALDARLIKDPDRTIDSDVEAALLRRANVSVATSLGDLDVVQRVPGVPSYATLAEDAIDVTLRSVSFRVCSLEHLVAMKRAGGRHIDLADLEALEPPDA